MTGFYVLSGGGGGVGGGKGRYCLGCGDISFVWTESSIGHFFII